MSEAKLYKLIVEKHKDDFLKLKRDNPELSLNKLALKFKKVYNSEYEPDYLRKVMAYVVNNNVREKINNNKDVDVFADPYIDFDLKSDYRERMPFNLPKYNNNILILNDIHIPYHDTQALNIAIRYGKDRMVNTILLNGDIADFYSISSFCRDPNLRDLNFELERVRQFLEKLRKYFPNSDIYFKEGNHEYRYQKYLMEKAPELFNVPEIQLQNILKLATYDIKHIDAFTVINAGKLPILHGHEIKSMGINIARTNLIKSFSNVASAHNHTTQEATTKRLDDSIIASYCIACLCGLKPDYAVLNRWNHGFAHCITDNSGAFEFNNLRIVNGLVK